MFLLDVYKRVGPIKKNSLPPWTHFTLGQYDMMRVREILDFSLAFSRFHADYSNYGDYFKRYTMALFPIEVNQTSEHNLLKEIMDDRKTAPAFYMISSFKLNNSLFSDEFKSRQESAAASGCGLLKHVKCMVETALQQHAQACESKFEYQVVGNLGAFDITVIISSAVINSILVIPHILRGIVDTELNLPLFIHSASFWGFSAKIDVESLAQNQELDIMLNLSANDIINGKMIQYAKTHFGEQCALIVGDHDISVKLNLGLRAFVSLFVSTEGPLSANNIEFSNYFCASQSIVFADCLPKCNNLSGHNNLEDQFQAAHENQNAVEAQRLHVADTLSRELNLAYSEVLYIIPDTISQTIANCLRICTTMLHDNLAYFTGLQVARILKNALAKIKKMNFESESSKDDLFRASTTIISDISKILPNALHIDSYAIDVTSSSDMPSPVSKLFFSYEYLLKQIFQKIDKPITKIPKNAVSLFLTIGVTPTLSSTLYFYNRSSSHHNSRLLSFNLANASGLSLENLPYMLHEVSHYLNINSTKRSRNICYHELLINYLMICLDRYLVLCTDFDESQKQTSYDALKSMMNPNDIGDIDNMTLIGYSDAWLGHFNACLNQFGRCSENQHPKLAVYDALSSYDVYREFCRAARDIIKEARADFMMLALGDYGIDEYLHILDRYFELNKLSPYQDANFFLRFTSVMGYFYQRDAKESSLGFERWFEDINQKYSSKFLCAIKEKVLVHRRLVRPLSNYLTALHSQMNWSGNPDIPLKFPFTANQFFNGEVSLGQETNFYIDNWYNCLNELGGMEHHGR